MSNDFLRKIKYGLVALVLLMLPVTNSKYVFAGEGDKVDLLFTSDLHSNVISYEEMVDGQLKNVGGFARLKTYIDKRKAENEDILILDCGDEVMGGLTQALIDTEAVELRLLSQFGYDVITVGNHEFDYGAKALSDMYSIVADKEAKRPAFVSCNIDWSKTDEYTNTVREGLEKYGCSDYVILNRNGVKIAVTGCLGIDAIKCSPTCELTFINYIDGVKNTVKKIKETENPDMIICLSHSGTGPVLGDTEDEILAKEVPDLDVIVSGHTHTVIKENTKIGDTNILSCGAYSLYTGDMSFTRNSKGRWDCTRYDLILMDESIEEDASVLAYMDEVNPIIDSQVLNDYGMKATDVLAVNGIVFENEQEALDRHEEMRLCNLLSDSYRYAANQTQQGNDHPFDIAVVPSGTVRDTFLPSNLTVNDAFCTLSLGKGPDDNVGYPLVSLYLTGAEVRTIAEVDASISDLMTTARLYTSGLAMEYNPKRMILSKVVDVWLTPAFLEDSRVELQNDKLYRIVTDSYSMSMLGAVTDMSKGILSVVPKDENGKPIEDPLDCIIYDANGNELKAWKAVCDYLTSFSKNEQGISEVPEYYRTTQNRKVVTNSFSPRAMFKNTSKYFYIIVGIILLIILIFFIIIRSIVKSIHKKKVFK